ncbi:MAG: hypothetical protein AAGA93_17035 [Actinomycetota bacterium]
MTKDVFDDVEPLAEELFDRLLAGPSLTRLAVTIAAALVLVARLDHGLCRCRPRHPRSGGVPHRSAPVTGSFAVGDRAVRPSSQRPMTGRRPGEEPRDEPEGGLP